MLGLPLYPWQDKALAPLEFAGYGKPIVQISVLTPNEAGKSSRIISGAALYWLCVHAKGKVGITTKDSKQLNEQIIPALEAQTHKFEGWKSVRSPYYRLTTPTGGVLIAFTTDDSARVEGLHGSPEAPLLWEIDEAKFVLEEIFDGVNRCGYQAIILASSGGPMLGSFYESHHGKGNEAWIKVRAGLLDCPHIAKEKIARIIAKYGEENPFTRSTVYGEFMQQSETDEYCVDLRALLNCLASPPKHRPGMKAGFCDFGAGVAEHVLATRDGNKIELAACWIESNKDAAAGRFIREFLKAGFTAAKASEQLECDASDKEIWQKLANAGWVLRRQNFGAPARLKQEYQSWGAEAWLEAGIGIASSLWILPEDDVFKAEAVNRKKILTATGKWGTEDKLVMAKRNVPSPSRADSVFGVMAKPEYMPQKEIFNIGSWREEAAKGQFAHVMDSIGGNVGY